MVFNLEDNPEFNKWAMKVAHAQIERHQPLVVVKAKRLAPLPLSRLINPRVESATALR